MKSFFSILLCLNLLLGGFLPACSEEAEKFPCLIEHFCEHDTKEPGDYSFLEFLVEHYFFPENDMDKAHDQLPSCHSCPAVSFIIPDSPELSSVETPETQQNHTFYSFSYDFQPQLTILQPPQA